jgi:hypothetical protein
MAAITRASIVEPTLRLVCAWCTKEIAPGIEPVSHGICRDCGDTLVEAHRKGRTFEALPHAEV